MNKYLLDTQVLIWWISDYNKLSDNTIKIIEDTNNVIFISVISLWEIVIKRTIGKLSLNLDLQEMSKTSLFTVIDLTSADIAALEGLPQAHKDPFDRALIAQSIRHNAHLMSTDPKFAAYPIKLIDPLI